MFIIVLSIFKRFIAILIGFPSDNANLGGVMLSFCIVSFDSLASIVPDSSTEVPMRLFLVGISSLKLPLPAFVCIVNLAFFDDICCQSKLVAEISNELSNVSCLMFPLIFKF